MKRILYSAILVTLILSGSDAAACDFCNCLMGINPYYTGSDNVFLNMLFQRSHLTGYIDAMGEFHAKRNVHGSMPDESGSYRRIDHFDGRAMGPVSIQETRITFELGYQHHFSDHLMATAIVPVTITNVESTTPHTVRGNGDPILLGHYVAKDLFSSAIPSTFLIGGGVKLPFGNHSMKDADGELLDPHEQPGTGTVDMILNTMLTAQVDGWTISADVMGKINTENALGNRIGNSLAVSSSLNRDLYRDNEDQTAIIGIAGVRGEAAGKDRMEGELDPDSGFISGFGSIGGEVVLHSLKLDLSVLVPLYQHRPEESPSEGIRLMSTVRYEF